jgi:hypothetical protein
MSFGFLSAPARVGDCAKKKGIRKFCLDIFLQCRDTNEGNSYLSQSQNYCEPDFLFILIRWTMKLIVEIARLWHVDSPMLNYTCFASFFNERNSEKGHFIMKLSSNLHQQLSSLTISFDYQ